MTTADDAYREFAWRTLQALGMGIKSGDNVFGDRVGIATGGSAERDIRCG